MYSLLPILSVTGLVIVEFCVNSKGQRLTTPNFPGDLSKDKLQGPKKEEPGQKLGVGGLNKKSAGAMQRTKFATASTLRALPPVPPFPKGSECELSAYYCLVAYRTGQLCGRTVYFEYLDFTDYCEMDYLNCMERYEVWQMVHPGKCMVLVNYTEHINYEYQGDFFLDQTYVLSE